MPLVQRPQRSEITMLTRNVALALTVASLGPPSTAALAKNGGDAGKRVAGSCTGSSSAKLKVKPDNGRLEAEFEVDQNRRGVTWAVQLRRDGKLVVNTNATTNAPSGSFSVERRVADPAGSDRIAARATSPSGEVCTASLTI
jgi:hypothetical protein